MRAGAAASRLLQWPGLLLLRSRSSPKALEGARSAGTATYARCDLLRGPSQGVRSVAPSTEAQTGSLDSHSITHQTARAATTWLLLLIVNLVWTYFFKKVQLYTGKFTTYYYILK